MLQGEFILSVAYIFTFLEASRSIFHDSMSTGATPFSFYDNVKTWLSDLGQLTIFGYDYDYNKIEALHFDYDYDYD